MKATPMPTRMRHIDETTSFSGDEEVHQTCSAVGAPVSRCHLTLAMLNPVFSDLPIALHPPAANFKNRQCCAGQAVALSIYFIYQATYVGSVAYARVGSS